MNHSIPIAVWVFLGFMLAVAVGTVALGVTKILQERRDRR